jgi:hypothetical protein
MAADAPQGTAEAQEASRGYPGCCGGKNGTHGQHNGYGEEL